MRPLLTVNPLTADRRLFDLLLAGVPESVAAQLCELGVPKDDRRVSAELVDQAWDLATHATEGGCALELSRQMHLGHFDALGYVLRCADTLAQALDLLDRYGALIHEGGQVTGRKTATHVDLCFEVPAGDSRGGLATWGMATLWRALRFNFEVEPHIEHVSLRLPYAARAQALGRVFGCPVHLGRGKDIMRLRLTALKLSNPAADPKLRHVLEQHLTSELAQLPKSSSVAQQVRAAILRGLATQQMHASNIAQHLHISERTLRRRLVAEGTSHRELLEDVRRELAIQMLSEQALSVDEVAYRSGYAQTSSFQRAFKRWTGMPPATFRAHCRRQSTYPPPAR